MNPRQSDGFYVYGEAPVLFVALVSRIVGASDWQEILILARTMTAILDASTVLAVFMLGWSLVRSVPAALAAAILYAAAPTALQLSNFFTVDAWLTATVAWSLFALDRLAGQADIRKASLAGATVGAAVAMKATAAVMLAPAVVTIALVSARIGYRAAARVALILAICAFLAFRVFNPFAFAGPGPLGLAMSEAFLGNFLELVAITLDPHHPPNWSWLHLYSSLDFLRDFAVFGSGPLLAMAILLLSCQVMRGTLGKAAFTQLLVPATAAIAFITTTIAAEVAPLRYAAPAIPVMAVLVTVSLARMRAPVVLGAVLLAVWWGAGTVALHDGNHPRIKAAHWLWLLPRGTAIANETAWDEELPVIIRLPGESFARWPTYDGHFELIKLDILDPDAREKATRLARALSGADYVAVSSGRQREVIPHMTETYPMTAAYYRILSDGIGAAKAFRLEPESRGIPLRPDL
ncbi:MAG: hypothetical protein GKR99_13795 [Rhodobacteraceae bacterium]|nr:hypothetical protein [Paracoccaceae bacterium]